MSVATFTKSGTKSTTAVKLDKNVFGIEVQNYELVKQAYLAYLANGRTAGANVKTRGLVRGGGKKPWKQKGTGRARFGSIRNPIWRGGGIVFGPTGHENYKMKVPTKSKKTALRQALSLANQSNKLIVIESFDIKDGKTNTAAKLLNKINASGNVLVVTDNKDKHVVNSLKNIQKAQIVSAMYVNVYDVLNADNIVITKKALDVIGSWLGEKKEVK
jgi:large subunit ribosomal protein L4